MLARLALILIWFGLLAPQAWAEPRVDMPAAVTPGLRAALLMSLNLPALTADETAMDREARRLTGLVRALGYLDGSVDIVHRSDEQGSDVIDLDVRAGPLYRIGSIQVIGLDDAAPAALQAGIHDLIAGTVGAPARENIVSQLTTDMVWRARSAAFATAEAKIADLVTDPSETVALTIRLTLGASAELGTVTFDSGGALDPAMLNALVPFSAGEPYSPAALEALDTALAGLPLIRQSRIEVLPAIDGRVPLAVSIRAHANPATLEHGKLLGVVLLSAALLALGYRQVVGAVGSSPRSRSMRLLDAAIAMVLIGALVLVIQRALAFAAFA